jgi:hypothetical protein
MRNRPPEDHLAGVGAELQFQHEQQRQRHSVPAQHAGPMRYIGPGIDHFKAARNARCGSGPLAGSPRRSGETLALVDQDITAQLQTSSRTANADKGGRLKPTRRKAESGVA